MSNLQFQRPADRHDWILWIMLVVFVWYILILGLLESDLQSLLKRIDMSDSASFVFTMYFPTIVSFLGVFVYTWVSKRNRFVFRSFFKDGPGRTTGMLLLGLLVGFLMNFGCILCALAHGDIKLTLDFAASQIPFFLVALVCVFIQSSSEELWCRGVMYERINVHYPVWVAVVVNGLFFAALHLGNPGASFLPILDIAICGIAFSLAKWYTGSIWFPAGIHTAWNFTQNLLFGLPNSGIVSEASIFKLDAANAVDTWVYSVPFGVEGGVPAVFADAILGIVCLLLAAKNGRLGELKQVAGKSPERIAIDAAKIASKEGAAAWHYPEPQTEDLQDDTSRADVQWTDGSQDSVSVVDDVPDDGEAADRQ